MIQWRCGAQLQHRRVFSGHSFYILYTQHHSTGCKPQSFPDFATAKERGWHQNTARDVEVPQLDAMSRHNYPPMYSDYVALLPSPEPGAKLIRNVVAGVSTPTSAAKHCASARRLITVPKSTNPSPLPRLVLRT